MRTPYTSLGPSLTVITQASRAGRVTTKRNARVQLAHTHRLTRTSIWYVPQPTYVAFGMMEGLY